MNGWKTTLRPVLVASFCGASLGVLALLAMFHSSAATFCVPIYYFTTRPAFVWFGMLLPFLLLGAPAVRRRWFILGCAFWLVSLLACEESLAWVRPFKQSQRTNFETAQMAYLSFSKAHGGDVDVLDVPLRVVGWNMEGGVAGAEKAMAQLAGFRPDVVLMEESATDVLNAAREKSAYFHDFYYAHGYSVSILSRYPLAEGKGALFKWTSGIWQMRLAPDRRITFVVVHLSKPDLKTQVLRGWTWAGLRKYMESRRRELEAVREMVRQQTDGSPVILEGDFNVPSHYPDLSIASEGLKNAFKEKGFGWGKTAPAIFPRLNIPVPAARPDMLFVPPDVKVYDVFSVPTRNSDHRPVVAEISIPVPRLKPVPQN